MTAPGVIFFALAREARPLLAEWRRAGAGARESRDARGFPGWDLGGRRVAVSGMGLDNARAAIDSLLRELRPAWVITAGFTGALRPGVEIGRVLVAADQDFPLTCILLARGGAAGRFISRPTVVVRAADKAALHRETGADAVDMESEVIRLACAAAGVPSATVRAVSDAAEHDLPLDFNAVVRLDGSLRAGRLAAALLRRPDKIAALMRLGNAADRAGKRLASVLAGVLEAGAG